MKAKVFLAAFITLLASQSMQALNVEFVNNKYPDSVGVKVYKAGKGSYNAEAESTILRGIGNPRAFYLDDTVYLRDLGIAYFAPDKIYEWFLPLGDLKRYKIPTTGDHTIIVSIEYSYPAGSIGIVVDNGEKMFVPVRPGVPTLEDV